MSWLSARFQLGDAASLQPEAHPAQQSGDDRLKTDRLYVRGISRLPEVSKKSKEQESAAPLCLNQYRHELVTQRLQQPLYSVLCSAEGSS